MLEETSKIHSSISVISITPPPSIWRRWVWRQGNPFSAEDRERDREGWMRKGWHCEGDEVRLYVCMRDLCDSVGQQIKDYRDGIRNVNFCTFRLKVWVIYYYYTQLNFLNPSLTLMWLTPKMKFAMVNSFALNEIQTRTSPLPIRYSQFSVNFYL